MSRKAKKNITDASKSYEDFLQGLKLIALGLSGCTVSLDRLKYKQALAKKEAARKIGSDYRLQEVGNNFFEVEAKLVLEVGADQKALAVECVFEAHFHAEEPVSNDHAQKFVKAELRLLMWPFFRQFISDTTARMAIPPITLPLLTERPK